MAEVPHRSKSTSKDFPPFPSTKQGGKTLPIDANVIVEYGRLLEALKEVEDALKGPPCQLDAKDCNTSADLTGQKVTVLIALEKTRKFACSPLVEGEEGLKAAIDELCSVHTLVGRLGFAHFLHGKASLIAQFSGTFTDHDLKFQFSSWDSLPRNVQKAAVVLGYTSKNWDATFSINEGYHELLPGKKWDDLRLEENAAVKVLGWDEDSWSRTYNDCRWEELPDLPLRAAMIVGFNDQTWKGNELPDSLKRPWLQLNRLERRALSVLGWNGQDWNRFTSKTLVEVSACSGRAHR